MVIKEEEKVQAKGIHNSHVMETAKMLHYRWME
jgi:hypothetical protein